MRGNFSIKRTSSNSLTNIDPQSKQILASQMQCWWWEQTHVSRRQMRRSEKTCFKSTWKISRKKTELFRDKGVPRMSNESKYSSLLSVQIQTIVGNRLSKIWLKSRSGLRVTDLIEFSKYLVMSRAFSGYMRSLESETILREKTERRRQERINRQNFRNFLKLLWSEKRMTAKTKWAQLVQKIVHEEEYLRMVGQPGSTPKELFDDFIDEQKERIKNQKSVLKQLIKSQGLQMSSNMEFEEFHAQLSGFQEYASIQDRETQKFLHEYWMNKLKEKEEETKKRYYKAMKKYQDYLHEAFKAKGVRELSEIQENPAFDILSSHEKEKIYSEELAHYKKKKEASSLLPKESRAEQEDGERSESGEAGEYLKKSKKHKKKHSKKKSSRKHREERAYDQHEPPPTKKYRHDDTHS